MKKTYLVSYVQKKEKLFTTDSIERKIVFIDEDDYDDAYDFITFIEKEITGYSFDNGITIIALSEIPSPE